MQFAESTHVGQVAPGPVARFRVHPAKRCPQDDTPGVAAETTPWNTRAARPTSTPRHQRDTQEPARLSRMKLAQHKASHRSGRMREMAYGPPERISCRGAEPTARPAKKFCSPATPSAEGRYHHHCC